ncbi:MAG: hypothetical protein WD578_10595 [Bacteroidales bacterium]
MKKFFFLALFFLTTFVINAQYVRDFSQDTSKYIQELTTLFGTSLVENEKHVFNGFIATWDSMEFAHRKDIMIISELMRQRSCRPRPQFIMFLKILEEFHREDKFHLGYDAWVEGYRSFMENEKTLIKEINNANQLIFLLLDQLVLYQTVSLSWKFQGTDYSFGYDGKLRIVTGNNTITGHSSGDSIIIHEVQGYIDPVSQQFTGKAGKVYWDRAGLDPQVVKADLSNFRIDFSNPGYKADSVTFYHTQLLDQPALGSVEDRITQIKKPENAVYPKFSSYKGNYELRDIVEGLDYRGAIAMEGANLAGRATGGKNAELDINYNDTLRVRMNSTLFLFGKELIKSPNAEISIYIENDSVYHPDLVMNYNIKSELLRLTKSKDFNSQGPYSNSYHRIDMAFDELNWVRSEPVIKMQAALGTALGNGLFESYDFFDQGYYESLQGMEYQNPLADLWTFARMIGGDTFSVEAYASNMGKAAYLIRHQLMEFSKQGFVYFDFKNDEVTIRQKLYDFIDASIKRRDYDIIRFISRTNAGTENATLDLATKDLTISGIPAIFLSNAQNVKLVPAKNRIIMKRNRDFQFDGTIDAGLFKFYGKNFFFEYDSFLINLQNIDSLAISARTGQRNNLGQMMTTTLDNVIEQITGQLKIDAPTNKSGSKSYPEYPIFSSRENSYVFFDEKTIQKGVYDKERFYFELFPFTIDSMYDFQREALKLEGTFISADILPPIEMEMSLRPDNSLGFHMTTPEEGIPVFGGKATFYSDIEMSNSGLRGYGSLDYITSTTWSDNFIFHPDSIMAVSRKFLATERPGTISYPLVENDIASIRYYPTHDVMRINRIEHTFSMYNDSTFFGGNLALRSTGLTGTGGLAFPDARFDSDNFKFQDQRVLADSAGVKLKKALTNDFTLITNDISINVDILQQKGVFTSREDYTLIDMPANLYNTRLNQITWFMARDEVMMKQTVPLQENHVDIGIDSLITSGPTYVSYHQRQDSLNFVAPVVYFNYSRKELNAEEVPFMEIGDSYIFPHEKKVQVLEKAVIKPLRNAKLMVNKESRFHLMHHANLVVDSRRHFRGSADYDYTDEFGNVYTFRMNHVEVDTSINTFGMGEVAIADSFRLSPYFEYQGQVNMLATKPFLHFAGGVRLTHDCNISKLWLKFDAEIDPDSILIPVERRMQNIELNNIYAGTLKARDSTHIYPTFLSGRKDYFDSNVTFSDGYLYYNKALNDYEIASLEKLRNKMSKGNYLALQTDSCRLFGEGDIDMNLDYGRISIKTVGQAMHSFSENSLDLELVMGMDFHFSQEALALFGRELDSLQSLEPVNLTSDFYNLAVRNMAGELMADKLETELGLYGKYSVIPDSLKYSILFNELKLTWNQESRSYRHNGKVGIGMIGGIQVNKKVDAYIEFVERGSGDIFDIYLKLNDNTWYYMAYSPGGFQVLSSNRAFNAIILDIPAKERTLKSRGRDPSYVYSLSSSRRMGLFIDRFLLFEKEMEQDN